MVELDDGPTEAEVKRIQSSEPDPAEETSEAPVVEKDALETLRPPQDHELHRAIVEARQAEVGEALGVPKLLAKLKEANPTWTISDKRLRKYLASHPGLSVKGANAQRGGEAAEPIWLPNYDWVHEYDLACGESMQIWPSSGLDDHLLLECKTKKVEPVRFPEGSKGSGLVAKEKLVKGAQVFKEDAYVWVPGSKTLTRAIVSGTACAYCGRFLSTLRSKNHASCPHHADSWHKPPPRRKEKEKETHPSSDHRKGTQTKAANQTGGETITEKPSGPEPCYQKFCNRVCATKSADTYGPLVCPQRNPQYHQVLRQADQEEFRAPHIVFKLYAAMLMANERGDPVTSEPPNDDAASHPNPATPPLEVESKPAATVNGHPSSPDAGADAADAPNGGPASPAAKKAKKSKGKKKPSSGPPETQTPTAEMREIIERISGLAVMSERARRERSTVSQFGGMSQVTDIRFGNVWKSSWHIVLKALHLNTGYRKPAAKTGPKEDGDEPAAEPTREEEEEATDRFWEAFWKRRLPTKLIADLFGIDKYMLMLGMVSLNQESDNGLFLLHARLNHSCDPNCGVQKQITDDRSKVAPSTIYIVTKRDIEADEELTLSYVPPDMPVEHRRRRLYDEYSFSCWCDRCRREMQEHADARRSSASSSSDDGSKIRTLGDNPNPGLAEDLRSTFS